MSNTKFAQTLFERHQKTDTAPSTSSVCKLFTRILLMLFPEQSPKKYRSSTIIKDRLDIYNSEFKELLNVMHKQLDKDPGEIAAAFMAKLPLIYELLCEDIKATLEGDPAARSEYEVIRAYPGFYAVAFHRMAHALYELNVPLLPRILSEYAHSKTGIDIHPGAKIGSSFFIDHGTGVVIGETASIGKNVKIYQCVTLGALSVSKDMASTKRHPTIEDDVIVYSGATILGGETIVGHHSIIGGNVWVIESIAPYSKVYNRTQPEVSTKK
ncbi:MAG TPA: serine O-acetyltransferase EpsC [Cytophagaceae bacterium]|jgi:serine O-acetyltransferase|nr:serine O-acetyltransferase EpsC [Cytophagaceae bacterium]